LVDQHMRKGRPQAVALRGLRGPTHVSPNKDGRRSRNKQWSDVNNSMERLDDELDGR
jgi:hypothetical protein